MSFDAIYEVAKIRMIAKDLNTLGVQERIAEVLKLYRVICNVDATSYLRQMITLDYLIGNEDRHTNNFGVIRNQDTLAFRVAPHFDNGLSLFEHDTIYHGLSLQLSIRKMSGKPFCTDLRKAYKESLAVLGVGDVMICRLDGMVFPSFKAYSYFKHVAEELNIPLIGEAGWLNEE